MALPAIHLALSVFSVLSKGLGGQPGLPCFSSAKRKLIHRFGVVCLRKKNSQNVVRADARKTKKTKKHPRSAKNNP